MDVFVDSRYLLGVPLDTCVDVQYLVTDEPHQVGEIWHGCLVDDKLEHGLLLDAVNVQGEGAHRHPHHTLRVVEELDRLRVEGEVVGMLQNDF